MITTARLILRPFAEADREAFRALVTDPSVTGDDIPVIPREDCDALFDFYLACWREEDLAYGAIERRADGAFLGIAGLALFAAEPPTAPLCEIGWALRPRFQGQGYAFEAAEGWLGHAFDTLGFDRVVAITWEGNPRSIGLMDRLGFVPDPDFVHPDGTHPPGRLAFAITPALWRAHRVAQRGLTAP